MSMSRKVDIALCLIVVSLMVAGGVNDLFGSREGISFAVTAAFFVSALVITIACLVRDAWVTKKAEASADRVSEQCE